MTRYIIIFTSADDLHASAVCERIRQIAPADMIPVVLDIGTFPVASRMRLAYDADEVSVLDIARPLPGNYSPMVTVAHRDNGLTSVRVDAIHSMWWRRPRSPVADERIDSPTTRRFIERNTRDTIQAFVSMVADRGLCVNLPEQDERASKKGYQLAVATSTGMNVPPTLIASEPSEIESFVAKEWRAGHEVIYKPVAITRHAQQSTQVLDRQAMHDLAKVAYCPTIFQRRIAGTDVRIVAIGGYKFAVEQIPSDRSCADVRLDEKSTFVPHALDAELSRKVDSMQTRLGLTYAAYDFRRDDHGELWFLEVNPGGQWLWLETDGRQRVSEAFARVLVEGRDTQTGLQDNPFTMSDLSGLLPAQTAESAYRRALDARRVVEVEPIESSD